MEYVEVVFGRGTLLKVIGTEVHNNGSFFKKPWSKQGPSGPFTNLHLGTPGSQNDPRITLTGELRSMVNRLAGSQIAPSNYTEDVQALLAEKLSQAIPGHYAWVTESGIHVLESELDNLDLTSAQEAYLTIDSAIHYWVLRDPLLGA